MRRLTKTVGAVILAMSCFSTSTASIHATAANTEAATTDSSVLFNAENADINNDFMVDLLDIAAIGRSYNSSSTSQYWSAKCDLNGDNIINIFDLAIVARCVGQDLRAGNTNSNFANGGMICQAGEWIYYSDPYTDGGLCKVKSDGSERTKLTQERISNIAVLRDWVYYIKYEDNHMYRIKPDGTQKTKLSDDQVAEMNVYGDYIFYTSYLNRTDPSTMWLCRMNTDGTGKIQLAHDYAYKINVSGDYIYYGNQNEYWNEDGNGYKIRYDGSSRTKIINKSISDLVVYSNRVYYTFSGDGRIYSSDLNGQGVNRLPVESGNRLNISDGWIIYCSSSDGKLYKSRMDGTEKTLLDSRKCIFISICGGNIYYFDSYSGAEYYHSLNESTSGQFGYAVAEVSDTTYSIGLNDDLSLPDKVSGKLWGSSSTVELSVSWNTSGVNTGKLGTYSCTGSVYGFEGTAKLTVNVVERGNTNGNLTNGGLIVEKDGWIYYSSTDSDGIYKKRTDGTGKTMLSYDDANYLNLVGDWLYFVNRSEGNIYKMKTDGTLRTRVSTSYVSKMTVIGDYIYYIDPINYRMTRIKTDGTFMNSLGGDYSEWMNVEGGWVYYSNPGSRTIRKVSINGGKSMVVASTPESSNFCGMVYSKGYIYYISSDYRIHRVKPDGSENIVLNDENAFEINVDNDNIYYAGRDSSNQPAFFIMSKDKKSKVKYSELSDVSSIFLTDNYIYGYILDKGIWGRAKGSTSVFRLDQ